MDFSSRQKSLATLVRGTTLCRLRIDVGRRRWATGISEDLDRWLGHVTCARNTSRFLNEDKIVDIKDPAEI